MEKAPLVPKIDFEWMLTDTCGNGNQGSTDGPKFNLFGNTYEASQSVKAGNAARFSGEGESGGASDANTVLNNGMGQNSMTIMVWIKWSSIVRYGNPIVEFDKGDIQRGFLTWLYDGLHQYAQSTIGCSSQCWSTYSFVPVLNTWYHVAFVYDGSTGAVLTYLNYALVLVRNMEQPESTIIW